VLRGHEGLEGCRGFVVETLELRTEAALGEKRMSALIGGQNLGAGLVLHEFDVDSVAVVIVKDEHVVVAGTGGSEKAARLVGVDLTGDPLVGNKDMVCACDGVGCGRIKVGLRIGWRCRGCWRNDGEKLGGA
jgi:hypothetical protein